ncbi:hypothetical protein LQW54_006054 [Pestalotiopsis sp. IQ-011]
MPATQHKPCIRCHACGKTHWDQKRADQCRNKAIRRAQRECLLEPRPVGVYLSPEQQQQQMYWQQQPQILMQQQPHMFMQQQPQIYLPQQQQQQHPQQLQQQMGEAFYNDEFGLSSFQPDWLQESHYSQNPMPQAQQQQQQQMMDELFRFDLPQESLFGQSPTPQLQQPQQQQLDLQQMGEPFQFDCPQENPLGQIPMPHTPPLTPPAATQPHPPQQPHQQASQCPAVDRVLMPFIDTLDDAELARVVAMLDDLEAGKSSGWELVAGRAWG